MVDFRKNFDSESISAALKKLPLILLVIILVPALWLFLVPKNPDNPLFNPALFRFENYFSSEDMVDAVRHMFPVGTEKEYVEKILAEQAGAEVNKVRSRENSYSYAKTPFNTFTPYYERTWNISFQYDENDRVKTVWVNGGQILPPLVIKEKK